MKKIIKKIRCAIFTAIAKYTLGDYKAKIKANGLTLLTKTTRVGQNVNFNGMIVRGTGRCSFGDNFHSAQKCYILTVNHNFQGRAIPYDDTCIVKDVIIEDNVWLGFNVIVLGGVTIGEGAIIQAGSVVTTNVPKYAIAGGHPAKVFSKRNVDHYTTLKAQGKFH